MGKMAEKIQVDYEGLNALASQIGEQGDRAREIYNKIQTQAGTLATSWSGAGAKDFQLEVEDLVLPAIQRLYEGLERAGEIVAQIRADMTDAEDEAVQQLPGGIVLSEEMDFIEGWEDREYKVYGDEVRTPPIPTIGVGFNLEKPGARERIEALGLDYDEVLAGNQGLTDEQIDELLQQDVEQAIADARDLVDNFDQLPHAAQEIVVDMAFNMGKPTLSGFKNTIDALENEDFAQAANEMQYKDGNGLPYTPWYEQTGDRAQHHVETMRNLATQGN
jgi:WXG100 family type VII secretion target